MAGALFHLFTCTADFPFDWKLPGALYDAGRLPGAAGSGGVIGGLLALCFAGLFNQVGAAIVLFLATLFLLFAALNVTVSALVERSRESAQLRAEEWKLKREEEQRKSEERRRTAEEARKLAAEEARKRAAEDEARRKAAEAEAKRLAAEEEARRKAAEADLPRHPVTAESPSRRRSTIDIPLSPEPSSGRRSAIDIPLDGPDARPAKGGKGAAAAATAAPSKTASPAAKSSVPSGEVLKEKDWLAEILTKDRLRAANGASAGKGSISAAAAGKVVQTAIRPKAAPVDTPLTPRETDPGLGTGRVKADELPQAPLPDPREDDAAFAAPPARPRPAPAAQTAPPPAQAAPAVSAAEAAAVLAEEKAAKAVEKAETVKAKAEMVASIEENLAEKAQAAPVQYVFPPVTLLTAGADEGGDSGLDEMSTNARRLSATIKSFGIPAEICDVTRGPTVTRYEVELEQGVKLNRLTNLSDDIALALGVSGVRIAPVPDKIAIVGIEVPNKKTTTVYLRDIIDTPAFREKSSSLTFAIGKDIGGEPIVGDIAKLPHLLIAGTTGSGKSVCMNCLILSLLYKSSPEDVRLIMIDPKMIELGVYNGIPHLLIPVVTDPKKAAGALQWSVMEMMKRYALIADSGARDLASYNKLMEKTEGGQKLPKIAILIDELADLMMTAAKEVEESICRIAQMGRAAGIHLVIATQRPSADVITGLMKANISSRIAFAVDSALNSRIILDASGAEKLVGKGDMLYAPIGAGKPTRIQGAFVTDEEREEVINFVKEQGLAHYDPGIQDEIARSADKDSGKKASEEDEDAEDSGDLDELFNEAVEVVLDSGMASVSMLQRRLKLGYSRAARIVDQMEEQGIVGPFEGSKPRAVLMSRDEWAARLGGSPAPALPEEDEGVPEELD
ncbi:MAG: DNA translocase FtsK [Oscillospiraceae bacterium]|nr:DNA translocase FtsK [Oscillospiraceae bacterium]